MRLVIGIAAALLAVSAAPVSVAWADDYCILPMSPLVPDGRYASEAEMRRGHDQMQSFVKQADVFLKCIETAENDEKTLHDKLNTQQDSGYAERMKELERRYNAAVEAQKLAADKFNDQLHIWRSREQQPAPNKPS